jgi:hypothetical protein
MAELPNGRPTFPNSDRVEIECPKYVDTATVKLTSARLRILEQLSIAKGPFPRTLLAEAVFFDPRRNLRPILDPLVEAGLVRRFDLEPIGERRETVHAITQAGREALVKATAIVSPSSSQKGQAARAMKTRQSKKTR